MTLRQQYILVMQRFRVVYLTIIPRARVGYEMVDSQRGAAELAITISYPTSASGIIVLLKTPKELNITKSATNIAKNVLLTRTPTIFVVHGI